MPLVVAPSPRPAPAWFAGAAGPALAIALLAGLPIPAAASTRAPDLIGRWVTPGGRLIEFGSCPEQVAEPLVCGRRIGPGGAGDREVAHELAETSPGLWATRSCDAERERSGCHRFRTRGPDLLDLEGPVDDRLQTWRRAPDRP